MSKEILTRHLPITVEKAASGDYDATFVLSASSPDRVNDTIDPKAYDAAIKGQGKLIALWQHKQDQPVGYWTRLKRDGGKLVGHLKIASTNLGQMVKQLLADGVPLGASIGFKGAGKPNEMGGWHFESIELLETSIVSVPAHPRAVQIAKSFGVSLPSDVQVDPSPGTSARSSRQNPLAGVFNNKKKGGTMRLSERITAAEQGVNDLRDRATEIVKALEAEDADLDVLNDELESVNADIAKAQKLVENLKATEAHLALKAEPVAPQGAPAIVKASRKDPKDVGSLFAKMAVSHLVADRDRISFDAAVEKTYGDAEYLKDAAKVIRNKSVEGSPPLNTFTAGAAAELVREATVEFIEALRLESVAAQLASRARQINFGGRSSVKITHRNPTALTGLTEPAWVHESRMIPVQGFGVGQQTVDRGKLASIIPFTLELLEANLVADLESELRLAMVEAGASRLDATFFSNMAAVTRVHPAGILNGVTAAAATAGGGIAAVSGDIQTLYNALTVARLGSRPVIVANTTDIMAAGFLRTTLGDLAFRDELASGTLMGIPVIHGPTIPQHRLIMVDAAYLAVGLDSPMFDVSRDATIVALNADNTTPSMAGLQASGDPATLTPGEVGNTAGPFVSDAAAASAPAYNLFQTYSAAIRMVQFAGWAPVAQGAVQTIQTTTWTS